MIRMRSAVLSAVACGALLFAERDNAAAQSTTPMQNNRSDAGSNARTHPHNRHPQHKKASAETRGRAVGPATVSAASGTTPALANAAVHGQTLHGEPVAGGAPEDIVSVGRRAQSIMKVPASVTTFSQAQMDIEGVRTVADIAQLTPGLDFQSTPNPTGGGASSGGSSVISIRGISSQNGDATTGIYIDDVPIQVRNSLNGVSGNTYPRIFDLDHVEVDRGPQGTLFGAGAEGGAVRFLTPQPSLTRTTAYVRSEVADTEGGEPSYETGGAIGGPIIENQLGYRISAWYRNDGGYVDRRSWENGEGQTNDNWQATQAYKAALTWAPIDTIRITPSIYYQYQHSNDTSVFWSTLSDPASGKLINGNALQLPYTDKFLLPSIKASAIFDDVTINAISSYFWRANFAEADESNYEYASLGFGDFYPTSPAGQVLSPLYNKTTQSNLTEELRLQNTNAQDRLGWIFGFFYSSTTQHDTEVNNDDQFANVLGEFDTTPVDYLGYNALGGRTIYYGDERNDEYQLAGYGNLSFRVTPKLTVAAGVRVAQDRLNYNLFATGPLNGGPEQTSGHEDGTPVTPRFSLTYAPSTRGIVYATVAKGYRIGGVNAPLPQTLCASDLASIGLTEGPKTYGSDSLWSYEAGFKERFAQGRLQFQASAFHIEWNQIQQKIVLPTCSFAFTENTGSVTSNGFDLQIQALVLRNLTLSLSLGYTDAHYDDTIGVGNTVIVRAGDTLGQSPWDLIASAQYKFDLPRSSEGYVRVDEIYHSENAGPYTFQHSDAYNYDPTIFPNPLEDLLDMRVGVKYHRFDISAFVDNLLDQAPELGYTHATVTSPVYNATTLRPLTAGLTLVYRY